MAKRRLPQRFFCTSVSLSIVLSVLIPQPADAALPETYYDLYYQLDLRERPAKASLQIKNNSGRLKALSFDAADPRFTEFAANGELEKTEDRYTWTIPSRGGELSWQVDLSHKRGDGKYDARHAPNWALFRGEDAFPAMASRAIKGAGARATLRVRLPDSWSVQTRFEERKSRFVIDNPDRFFDRPTGWLVAGKIGTRKDTIAQTSVAVSAPRGQNVRRQDILALINWTLPDLKKILPDFPASILVVSANDPFWRGGLSGPESLFLHAGRPLISENGTSTLVHELFHVGFSRSAEDGADWIIEGLAEFYAVEILNRSGTTTDGRRAKTLEDLADWAKEADTLTVRRSTGATTAKAALLFNALNAEIRDESNGKRSLDDAVERLSGSRETLGNAEFKAVIEDILGRQSRTLQAYDID